MNEKRGFDHLFRRAGFVLIIIFLSFPILVFVQKSSAPYPPSEMIKAITYDKSTHKTAAPGSDQFPTTWGPDGNIWTAWGDGGGFNGNNNKGRVYMGVARIEGNPPNYKGVNVWGGVNPISSQKTEPGKPNGGLISISGTIYMYSAEQGKWKRSRISYSTDLGKTWKTTEWIFDEPAASKGHAIFTPPSILQFGKDYQSARDNYVYGYGNRSPSSDADNELYLFRVDKNNLLNRKSYEFFKGTDGSGNPIWTKDINAMEPVFKDKNKVEWGMTAFFHPVFKKYWLIVRHNGKSGSFGIFDAPEPWGPWTTISYGTDFPTWVYTPTGSASRPAYVHSFPAKWISSDGKTMWDVFDRGDQFNIAKVTVEKLL